MLERASQPVHAPRRDYVKVFPCDTLDEPGKGRTLLLRIPKGICHLVGQYLRFSLEGIALRT